MRIISIYNEKGGVGKTTAIYQIAGILARRRARVLIVDCDIQSNSSSIFLSSTDIMANPEHLSVCDVVNDDKINIWDAICDAPISISSNASPKEVGIKILPSNKNKEIKFYEGDILALKKRLDEVKDDFDYCLIDFPPERPFIGGNNFHNLVTMGLCATDKLIIPCTPDEDSFSGLSILTEHINSIRRDYNPSMQLLGCFLNNVTNCSNDAYIIKYCESTLSETGMYTGITIRSSGLVKASKSMYRPLAWYYTNSEVAKDYERLTNYIIEEEK